MIALLGGIGVIIGIVVSIGTIMAMVRIITNCGYSGWWVLLPFVPPLVGYVFGIFLLATLSLSGGRTTGSHILGLAVGYFVIEILSWLVSWYIFSEVRVRRLAAAPTSTGAPSPAPASRRTALRRQASRDLRGRIGCAAARCPGRRISVAHRVARVRVGSSANAGARAGTPPEAHAAGSPPAPAPAHRARRPGGTAPDR